MKTKKTTKKIILIAAIVAFEIMLMNAAPVKADLTEIFGSVSVDNMPTADSMMSDMGINPKSLKEMLNNANVANKKESAPEVSITFTPTNPEKDQNLTARSMASGFSNNTSSDNNSEGPLYYTWYLKHHSADDEDGNGKCPEGCVNDSGDCLTHKNGNCDWDESGTADINDYKIEAIRQAVKLKFDSTAADYYGDSSTDSDDDGYTAVFGGENKKDTNAYCYIHDYKSGKDYEIVDSTGITLTLDPDNPIESDCSHLFPTDKSGDQVGSNSFGKTREKLFGTSPYNADTLGAGEKDEAMATGLGIKDLTWKYQPGDKVGVVVEGVSMNATKFNDSSLMIMWSLPNDDQHCTLDDLTDDYAPSSEQDSFMFFLDPLSITNNVESLRVATLNEDGLNTCLENNMKEPTEGGNAQPLEVSLSSTPDNPMADDLISVQSSFDNYSKDSSQLSYEWTITPKDEDGNDITADDGVKVAGTAPFLKGNNLASVSFRLKGNSDNLKKVKSVSVKLIISDYFIPGNTTDTLTKNQKGSASLDIDLNPAGQKIKIYQAASSDGEKVTHDSSKELCTEASSQGCAVLNNQVVEAEVDNATDLGNFSWTLNGNPLYCSDSMSSECGADTQGNVVFFAISAEEGQTLELTLNTKNTSPDSSGQSMTLNKKFIVVAPSVKIETDGTSAWPKYLGEYTPLNSQDCVDPNDATKDLCADYSQSVFETGSGNSVALSAKFSPEWLEDDPNLEIVWTIDGETANSSGFTAGDIGGVHNVQINATYTYPEAMRKILNKFAVSQLDSGEKEFSDAAQIEVVEVASTTAAAGTKKFIASLLSNLPEQVFFLLRIMLSIFVILLVSNIVFIFSPSRETDD